MGCYRCCHRPRRGGKVPNGGRRDWRAGRRERESLRRFKRRAEGKNHLVVDVLTWDSRRCSSCSYSCTCVAEGGSRPERELGCVRRSDGVWGQPAGGAGRGQPQRAWKAGWGRRRRLWGEIDLQKQRNTVRSFTCCDRCTHTAGRSQGATRGSKRSVTTRRMGISTGFKQTAFSSSTVNCVLQAVKPTK